VVTTKHLGDRRTDQNKTMMLNSLQSYLGVGELDWGRKGGGRRGKRREKGQKRERRGR